MTNHNRSGLQRFAIIAAFVWQIASTTMPALGLGEPIGDRSDASRTLITPAGWAFSIWGLLYLGSGIFAVWQALPAQRDNALLARIGWPAAGIFFFNGLWALYTQMTDLNAGSAVIIVLGLLSGLACVRMVSNGSVHLETNERWLVAPVLSALGGWLTAATIVNIAAALKFHGVDADDAAGIVSAAIVATGGVIVALAVVRSRGNFWYAAPFLWALLAIYFQGGQSASAVAAATVFSALLVMAGLALSLSDRTNREHWFG